MLDDSVDVRIEWAEGTSPNWDIWCFDSSVSFEEGDIVLVEDADLLLALNVLRVTPTTRLKGRFHHWEISAEESELSVAEIRTQAGI